MRTAARRRPALGGSLVAFAFTVTMLGTTLPTPLYPALGAEFGFGELLTTVIFATYPVGVVASLLLWGHWSDHVGRRPVLLAGLGCSALSAVAFLMPAGLAWVFVARVLSGLSAGIFTGTATATIVDLVGTGTGVVAGLVAAAANMGGLGLGPLVAGLLAQWAPDPLRLPFVVDLVLIAAACACVLIAPEPVPRRRPPPRGFQPLRVPAAVRPAFVRAGVVGFAGFAVLGLFGAVSPAFLGEVLHHRSTALVGGIVMSVFAASVAGQLVSILITTGQGMVLGCCGLIVGMIILGSSLPAASLGLLVLGGVVAGVGQGLSFRAGLGSVTRAAPVAQRGQISSALFVALYVGIAIPVVGEGIAATTWGLVPAGISFSVLVGVLAAVVLVLVTRSSDPVTHSGSAAGGGSG